MALRVSFSVALPESIVGLRFCLLKVLDGGGGGGGDTDGDTDGDADADADAEADLNNFAGDTKEATCFDLSLQKKGAKAF